MRSPRRHATPWLAVVIASAILIAACGGAGDSNESALPEPAPAVVEALESSTSEPAADDVDSDPSVEDPSIEELVVEDPPAPIPPAMWDRTLGEIGPDGEVSLQMALDAFQLAIAPIPGSDVEANEHDPGEAEGTVALTWILRHYQDLDPEQRAVLAETLSPVEELAAPPIVHGRSAPVPARSARQAAPPAAATTGCYGQKVMSADSPGAAPFRSQLDALTIEIEGLLGGEIEMVRPVTIQLDDRELGLGTAYTWGDPGDCDENSLATCTIHLSPRAQRKAPAETRAILAHELMHCFVFHYLGMTTYDLPPWVGEGIPAWVGEQLGGGTPVSEKWWEEYLRHPERPLYSRAYDAIGFYSHLDEVGTDPWTTIVDTLDGFENEPAYEGAGAIGESFHDTWPAGFLRTPERGAAWDTDGQGITDHAAEPTVVEVAPNTRHLLEVVPTANRLLALRGGADILRFDVGDGSTRLSSDDGTDEMLTGSSRWCVREGGCECPSGEGDDAPELDGEIVVAVTGGTDAAQLSITGESFECDEDPDATDPASDEVDECLVGTWESYAAAVQDTTTGMPNISLGGGEHVILEIDPDGTFTMDFDDSTPVLADIAGNEMGHETRGVAHGRLTATDGRLVVVEHDYATSLRTNFVGMGDSREQKGGTALATGTYECTSNSLDTEEPTRLGRNVFLFESA